MSQTGAAPVGAVPEGIAAPTAGPVAGILGDYGVGADMNPGGVATPPDNSVGMLGTVFKGMQNMLGSTPEERVTNAKALAAGVKDINGLVSTMGQSTLLKRMMEAQGKGLGFMEGVPTQSVGGIPPSFNGAAAAPIMSQLGFK